MTDALPSFLPALPEIFLALSAMALLVLGAFRPSPREIAWLSVLVLAVAVALVASFGPERQVSFYGMYVTDGFAVFMKIVVLVGSLLSIVLSMQFNEKEQIARFEYPVLVLLATTGMMVMISANDLISKPRALCHRELPARQPALGRSRSQILRPGRAVLGHAALRRVDGLRICRDDRL
jgi:NADH-quinone oxidoreductase subunit N